MRGNCRDVPALVMVTLLMALASTAISGCIKTPSSRLATAKQALLGKSESAILACAGAPRMVSSQHGLRVLSYYKGGGVLEQSFPGSKSGRPEGVRHACLAIVTMENDGVTEVQYQIMPESTAGHEHCEELFQYCRPNPESIHDQTSCR